MEEQTKEVETQSSGESNSNKTMLIIVAVVGVIVIAVGAFFLTRSRSGTDAVTDTAIEDETVQDEAMVDDETSMPATHSGEEEIVEEDESMTEEEAKEISVSGFSFGLEPSSLTLKAGEKVSLTFVPEDAVHNFVIEGTDIATEVIPGGEETTIEFTAPEEPGEYTYYCSVGNHRAQGMEGTLIVE